MNKHLFGSICVVFDLNLFHLRFLFRSYFFILLDSISKMLPETVRNEAPCQRMCILLRGLAVELVSVVCAMLRCLAVLFVSCYMIPVPINKFKCHFNLCVHKFMCVQIRATIYIYVFLSHDPFQTI